MRSLRRSLGTVLIAMAAGVSVSPVYGQSPATQEAVDRPVDRATVPAGCTNGPTGFINQLYRTAAAHGNYGDLSLRPCKREILLYGRGRPARDVVQLIGEAPVHGLTVIWRQSRYSRAELRTEAQWLRQHRKIWAVDITSPARGLTVYSYSKRLLQSSHPRRDLGVAYPVMVRRPPHGYFLDGPFEDATGEKQSPRDASSGR